MSSETQSNAAPPPASVLFARGALARLKLWPALQIAINNGWGGPESYAKGTWIASELVDAFESQIPTPDALFVEEMLLQIMSDEFETVLEDGSAEAVAGDVVKLWEEACVGRAAGIVELERRVDSLNGRSVQAMQAPGECDGDDDDESDDDGAAHDVDEEVEKNDMDAENDEAPQLIDRGTKPRTEPVVDEDGFTLVQGRGRGR